MEITDRMGHVKDQLRQHRLEDRLEHAQRENVGLRAESEALKEEHGDISKRLSAIERTVASRPRRHRLRRLATLLTAGAGAYVLGAKAGRQRYDEIRSSIDRLTRKGRSTAQDIRARAGDVAEEASAVSGRLSDAGQVLGETVQSIAQGASVQPEDRSPTVTTKAAGEA